MTGVPEIQIAKRLAVTSNMKQLVLTSSTARIPIVQTLVWIRQLQDKSYAKVQHAQLITIAPQLAAKKAPVEVELAKTCARNGSSHGTPRLICVLAPNARQTQTVRTVPARTRLAWQIQTIPRQACSGYGSCLELSV